MIERLCLISAQIAKNCARAAENGVKSSTNRGAKGFNFASTGVSAGSQEDLFRLTDEMRQILDEIDRLSGRDAPETVKKDDA